MSAGPSATGRSGNSRSNRKQPRRTSAGGKVTSETIIETLKRSSAGLRSEQLQKALGVSKKSLVGPLKAALDAKTIRKKGERRATTYFAA